MGMLVFTDEQIEDARLGIQRDINILLMSRAIRVDLVPNTDDVKFIARGLGTMYQEEFDEMCRRHLNRVVGLNYDS